MAFGKRKETDEADRQMQQLPEENLEAYDGIDNWNTKQAFGSPTDPNVAQLQIDANEIIEDYKMELTGTAINKHGDLIQIDDKPLCNMNGALKLIPYVRTSLSKTVTLGKMDTKKIDRLMFHLANDLVVQLAKNYKDYGIKFAHVNEVKEITCAYMETNFSRSHEGFTSKLIGQQLNINEVRHINQQQGNGRRFSLFKK